MMKVKPTIELIVHPEYIPVRGNCSAIDDETDAAVEKVILDRLETGDIWAWCTVEVKASYKNLSASTYLGCCSYRDAKDFQEPGNYYDDMVVEAMGMLDQKIQELLEELAGVEIDMDMEPPRDLESTVEM